MDEQLEFVKLIATRLEAAGIEYMLTGSIALLFYGTPRMTRDIDLVIACRQEDADRIARLFEEDCYVDADTVREAAVARGMFNIIHCESILKADFIIRKDEPYRVVEFGRRRRIDTGGFEVCVVSAEDLVLSKLAWMKESGSELQRRDVSNLLEASPGLDGAYLEEWARHLGVADLLREARGE
jgi:hypothetical protein